MIHHQYQQRYWGLFGSVGFLINQKVKPLFDHFNPKLDKGIKGTRSFFKLGFILVMSYL